MLQRISNACLMRPEDIPPSHDFLEVAGAFNPGAVDTDDGVMLMVRVAETVKETREGFMALPRWTQENGLEVDWVPLAGVEVVDPRVVRMRKTNVLRLTFISHLRVYECGDGREVNLNERSRFIPTTETETYGVEDPRITPIDGRYYFTYVAVSKHGAATALASTEDFRTFKRHGVIFPCENKDVLLFPERVGGEYLAFHRPNPANLFTPPEMWLASSPDLTYWGKQVPFHGAGSEWEMGRVGGGVPPFRVEGGWLEIYHGNVITPEFPGVGVYSAGAILMDAENPQRILRRTRQPIMMPEAPFEREGFVPNVVFPAGAVERGDSLLVYYGAADAFVGLVEWNLGELLGALE